MKWNLASFKANEVWFTSDTHFGHERIIKICDRPYKDVEEMNQALIDNWNSMVMPDHHVFHLGDFALGGKHFWEDILSQLNGHVHLILGNHDYQNARAIPEDMFASIHDQFQIRIIEDGQFITMNHYPLLTWGGIERGVWNAYGHWHTTPKHPLEGTKPLQMDVGVDNNDYTPISYLLLKDHINEKQKKS